MADQGEADRDQSSAASQLHRQQVLRELAQRQEQRDPAPEERDTPSRSVTGTPHPRGRRPLVASTAGILLVGVVAAVIVYAHVQPGHTPTATPVPTPQIIPASTDLACEQDVAWSPNGTRIAIVGYQRDCPSDDYTMFAYWPGRVDVFDAQSHKLLTQLQPDTAIAAALHLQAPVWATPGPFSQRSDTSAQVIHYWNVQWSPDGKSVALSFSIYSLDGPAVNGTWPTHVIFGLYVANADGSSAHVLAHTVTSTDCPRGAEWNVQTGALAAIPPLLPGCGPHPWISSFTSPALTYSWGQAGQVTGSPELSASEVPSAPPAGPVGNPDGGASFSIWQPGVVSWQTTPAMQQAKIPPIPTFNTSFLAWSPDGQYVLEVMAQDWRLSAPQAPVPSVDSLRATALDTAPVLPARDAVVGDLLSPSPIHVHNPYGSGRGSDGAVIAWSPNGRFVALVELIGSVAGAPSPNQWRVVVFDAASGNPLVTLKPDVAANPNFLTTNGSYTALRWSADGSHLLLFDGQLGVVSIFGADQLPKA